MQLLPLPRLEPPEARKAVDCIGLGDVRGLAKELDANPELVRTPIRPRKQGWEYVDKCTLLHLVAHNPPRLDRFPEGMVDVARLLLERGADVHAHDEAWGQPLGMVATCFVAAASPQGTQLIDLFIEHGAKVDYDNNAALRGCLSYLYEGPKGMRRTAKHLRKRGAPVDLCFAAALGEVKTMRSFFLPDGKLDRTRAVRFMEKEYRCDKSFLEAALVYASVGGSLNAVKYLVEELGLNPKCKRDFTGDDMTPMVGTRCGTSADKRQLAPTVAGERRHFFLRLRGGAGW